MDLNAFLESLTPQERIPERRHLCRTDLYYLLRYELHRPDLARPWFLDRCREVQAEPDGHLDLWPREHGKTTVITFGKTVQDILSSHGDDPDPRWAGIEQTIGIFSHTRPIAKGFLRQIKQEFEQNESLKALFPDILWEQPRKQAPKWSEDDGIIVRRRAVSQMATVEAWGIVDAQPTGKHFSIMVYDDVVTVDSVTTAEMISKTTSRWGLSVNLGTEGGRKRYIGTRYDESDTYQVILDRGAAVERKRHGSDTGQASGRPLLISQAAWDQKRREMDAYTFSCQILNTPTSDENAFFPMIEGVTLKWYDPEKPPPYLRRYATTDGAVTDERDARGTTSYTVHIVVGVDPQDNIYLLDLWRTQAPADVWIDAQIDLVEKHRRAITNWWGETGVIEKAVGPLRNKRMQERKCWFSYNTLPTIGEGNKEERAASFQGRWNQGKVFLPRGAEWVTDYLLELRRFPNSTTNDQVDASGMVGRALDELYRAAVPPPGATPMFQADSQGRLTATEAFVRHQIKILTDEQKRKANR